MNVYYYAAAESAVYRHQEMPPPAAARLLHQQKPAATAVRKRGLSAILDEQLPSDEEPSQADCTQLFEQFGCNSSEGPQLLEDFHTFLAREGCSNHPWITSSPSLNADLPTSDEDFVAYLARSNGINDNTTISKLRQVLGQAPAPRKPRTRFRSVQPASQWQRVV